MADFNVFSRVFSNPIVASEARAGCNRRCRRLRVASVGWSDPETKVLRRGGRSANDPSTAHSFHLICKSQSLWLYGVRDVASFCDPRSTNLERLVEGSPEGGTAR